MATPRTPRPEMAWPPIEDHGIVGDLATAALVGTDAGVDFLCWPRFDSPTVFAALLDPARGGRFRIAPVLDGARRRQVYLPDTNILMTRFHDPEGVAEVADFMAVGPGGEGSGGRRALVRWVRTVKGRVRYEARCAPRLDYGRAPHRLRPGGDGVAFEPGPGLAALRLDATVPLRAEGDDAVAAFTLGKGETATFVLHDAEPLPGGPDAFGLAAFEETLAFWHGWSARSTYRGRWRETVGRSALVLKLLTSREHGSMVAAPTFALPEEIGGERNWDYRYVWIRDAAFTMYALVRLGHTEEALAFTRWVEARLGDCGPDGPDGPLRTMYGLDGGPAPPEETLDHLAGYRRSAPVRIGNGAREQIQLDIYGELMDAAYLAAKYSGALSHDAWAGLTRAVDWVCANWERPDAGIWEIRGEPRPFLHSRLMCWVAVDRALRLAGKLSLPAPFAEWAEARNALSRSISAGFWDAERRTFVQHAGGAALDASVLLMPLVRFIAPEDPRWLSTLDAIGRELADDALVRRYDTADAAGDGLRGGEGSFGACSFWYVECLARAGRLDEARLLFEKLLGYANHLGLYAEEIGPGGEHLGNFPQALTHLALISTATYLDRRLSGEPRRPWSG